MAETPSSGLSTAQARHVLATFRHVDALLERVLAPLARDAAEDSLTAVHNDFSTEEVAALREAVDAIRAELEAGVCALDLPTSVEPASARWAAATAARLALITLAELDAHHLSAYGAVSDAAVEQIVRVRVRLDENLEALRRLTDRP
ncbi:MAG: hypothetical protein ACRESR_10295 [Gammaproteobacteria bacterium]